MSRPKVGAIGVLIFVSFILDGVAVFTPGWITVSATYLGYTISDSAGLIPYSSNEVAWFAASSWMMFISFGLFFPLLLVYLRTGFKIRHDDCYHSIRHSFHAISFLSSIITILIAVSFTLMAINVPGSAWNQYGSANANLGYSAYLALSSAILLCCASLISSHVARRHCH